jgi:pyruvate dehydrogenase E1 component alpha subunit
VVVNGVKPEEVFEAASRLIAQARAGEGAGFIVADCYRFYGHARKDKSPYRDATEEQEGRKRDPIPYQRALLEEAGLLGPAEYEAMEQAAGAEMDAAAVLAAAAPLPETKSMFEDVFDPSLPKPQSLDERLEQILGGGS